jgi:phosphoribosylanthranilate isomerase
MRVKICGITRIEDGRQAEALGAWALGFIFYPPSKRYIAAGPAGKIIREIQTQAFGVFVNQTDEALLLAREIPLKGLQLHGDETPEECRRARAGFPGILIKALRPQNEDDLGAIAGYDGIVDYILLDAASGGAYGGTGHQMDWTLAEKAKAFGIPVILAGGLNAGNIGGAAAQVKPFAADLSSGVEAAPGIKDPMKMAALFEAVKGVSS